MSLEAVLKIKAIADQAISQIEGVQSGLEGLQSAAGRNRGLAQMGQDLQQTGFYMQSLGQQMTQSITQPVMGAVQTAASFEAAMNGVAATSGATGEEFEQLSSLARELGASTQFSASEAASAQQYLAMAGFETNEILGALPDTLNLAAAGNIDLARAADISSNILSGMGLEVEDLSHMNNVLAETARSSNTNISMMGESFKYVAPIAAATGQGMEAMSASIGILGDAGIQGSMAGTTLRRALLQLSAPTGKAQAALDRLGISTTDATGEMRPFVDIVQDLSAAGAGIQDVNDIFGTTASAGMSALLARSDDLAQFSGRLEGVGDTAQEMSEIQMRGFSGQMKAFQSAMEGLAISIGGSGLMQLGARLVGMVTKVVQAIANAPPPILNVIAAIAGVAAVIGPLLVGLGMLIGLVGGVMSAMGAIGAAFAGGGIFAAGGAFAGIGSALAGIAAIGFGPIIAGVAGLAAAGLLIYKNWGKISSFFSGFWEGLSSSMGPALQQFQVVGATVMTALQPIISWLSQLIFGTDQASGKISNLGMAFGMMAAAVINAVASLPMNLGMIFQAIGAIISSLINIVRMQIQMIISSVQMAIATVTSGVMGAVAGVVGAITGGMAGFVSAVVSGIAQAVAAFTQFGSQAISAVTAIAGQMFSAGANIVGRLADGIMSGIGRVTSAMSSVASAARSMLPMSPVPTGPLTVLNRTRSNPGAKIVDMLAGGIRANAGALGGAMSGAVGNLGLGGGSGGGLSPIGGSRPIPPPSNQSINVGGITLNISLSGNGEGATEIADALRRELPDVLDEIMRDRRRVNYA